MLPFIYGTLRPCEDSLGVVRLPIVRSVPLNFRGIIQSNVLQYGTRRVFCKSFVRWVNHPQNCLILSPIFSINACCHQQICNDEAGHGGHNPGDLGGPLKTASPSHGHKELQGSACTNAAEIRQICPLLLYTVGQWWWVRKGFFQSKP